MQLDLRAGLQFNEARLENISIDISKPSDGWCPSVQASPALRGAQSTIARLTARGAHKKAAHTNLINPQKVAILF